MEVGEEWAYRARGNEPLVRVVVIRLGRQRPPRVLVRFLDAELKGREEWVSPARLKVPWAGVAAFRRAEQAWDAVAGASEQAVDSVEHRAAIWVVSDILPQGCCGSRELYRWGVLRVRDRAGFADAAGCDAADLVVPPGYVDADGSVVLPWSALLALAQQLVERDAARILEVLRREDGQAEHDAIHGRFYPSRKGGTHIDPEICADLEATTYGPARTTVRRWCGAGPRERQDELLALRAEVLRLGDLLEEAITALRQAGQPGQAQELERRLGVPVAHLRERRAPQ
ncbi:hypothetical protein [Dactylosporangium salmoneum]|uniref:PE-PGRS family protein n=1 Tax=Dactylosporangium salmoneum TaxID=53361 RepID=A0ABP5SXR1_9ACTN